MRWPKDNSDSWRKKGPAGSVGALHGITPIEEDLEEASSTLGPVNFVGVAAGFGGGPVGGGLPTCSRVRVVRIPFRNGRLGYGCSASVP